MIYKFLLILSITLISCQSGSNRVDTQGQKPIAEIKDPTKIYNLMGEELPPKQLTEEARATHEKNLQQATSNYEANPDSLELIIWYGRRLAYLGRYLEAIDIYTTGLEKFPTSYKLRRHRGHRYITTRQLEKAVNDFEMAAFYSVNAKNAIEPDGLPNKLNKPLGNDKFNIWYHYGLAHYLNGRYDKAISAYKKCMEFSDNDDLLSATSYWLYMTYKKIGNAELADQLLAEIDENMEIIENDAYLDLLLLFKGEKKAEALLKRAFPEDGNIDPTLGYGIGNWYQQQGNTEKANEIFLKILDSPSWDAFGYLAAEAELTAAFPVPIS
ncbi:tetratricopeptide repeat protein [Ekhidna sp.]|jgi:tetratricopeptide (TPR) repeat protein|uniref:tetratricopeptide repeat protein n=1 Tax=Ekhidna sp. TaxID=2608089 RepID=UPI0032ECA61A